MPLLLLLKINVK